MKELKTLPTDIVQRIVAAVASLAENPFPQDSKKLVGSRHTYRLREGSYRILYNVHSEIVLIEIIGVGHRKDIYR